MGPGEVDDELEDEVGSECAKYGTVTRVLIFEITEPNFPVHEAVRIFVQFERSEETTKALVDLDGRYFGGRVVRASFYDEEKFSKKVHIVSHMQSINLQHHQFHFRMN